MLFTINSIANKEITIKIQVLNDPLIHFMYISILESLRKEKWKIGWVTAFETWIRCVQDEEEYLASQFDTKKVKIYTHFEPFTSRLQNHASDPHE